VWPCLARRPRLEGDRLTAEGTLEAVGEVGVLAAGDQAEEDPEHLGVVRRHAALARLRRDERLVADAA